MNYKKTIFTLILAAFIFVPLVSVNAATTKYFDGQIGAGKETISTLPASTVVSASVSVIDNNAKKRGGIYLMEKNFLGQFYRIEKTKSWIENNQTRRFKWTKLKKSEHKLWLFSERGSWSRIKGSMTNA